MLNTVFECLSLRETKEYLTASLFDRKGSSCNALEITYRDYIYL